MFRGFLCVPLYRNLLPGLSLRGVCVCVFVLCCVLFICASPTDAHHQRGLEQAGLIPALELLNAAFKRKQINFETKTLKILSIAFNSAL